MRTNKLGITDLDLTVIGLGTWAIGGDNWGMSWGIQDDQESIKVIQHAIDLGINWIDTAAIYGMGPPRPGQDCHQGQPCLEP
jgi:aryl-alcohol dehydrogenase-like predicted oxidoreductase